MSVKRPLFGSYIERWRFARSTGNTFAEGWLEPLRQNAGLSGGRTRAVNQTRPRPSNIGLCIEVWLSQIGFGPQYGEGWSGSSEVEGVFGSRTGCLISLVV